MTDDPVFDIDTLALITMQLKGSVAAEGDPLCAMLLLEMSDGVHAAPWPHDTRMMAGLAGALRQLDVFTVAFLTDSYGECGEDDETIERHRSETRSLEQRFEAGDPDVYECLTLVVMRRDGTEHFLQIPYDMTDGVPVYRDPVDLDGVTMEGRVPDALRAMVRR